MNSGPLSNLVALLFGRLDAIRTWFDSPTGKRVKIISSLVMSVAIVGLLVQAIVDVGWAELVAVTPTSPL